MLQVVEDGWQSWDGMRFRIPEKGEAIIDSADTVLPEKKKT